MAICCAAKAANRSGLTQALGATTVMQPLPIYASLLAILFVALSVRTLRLRRSLKIAIGDARDQRMLRAMRVHSNFAEYVPFALFLLYLVQTSGAPSWLIHGLGLCLLFGRISHAFGVSRQKEPYQYRVAGMALTFTVLLVSSAYLLFVAARGGT